MDLETCGVSMFCSSRQAQIFIGSSSSAARSSRHRRSMTGSGRSSGECSGTAAALNEELGYGEYETRTRGVRKIPAARPAAEGIYTILRHGEHTHLANFLELPKHEGPVERELNIKREASYIIAV